MPGIPPSVIVHKLMVDPSHQPVKQRRRSFALERNQVVAEEVHKLLQAGFIQEVDYPEWLANVVLVKKNHQEVENVRQFHRPQSSMSQRQLPVASD
jgi:hypothetical protein